MTLPGVWLIADSSAATAAIVERACLDALHALGPSLGAEVALVDRDLGADAGGTPDRDRLARLERLRAATHAVGAWLVVHRRPDLAALAGADGVQLPERDLPAARVVAAMPGLAVGRSCHDADGLTAAARDGASWALLSPVWAPTSKAADSQPLGLERFQRLVAGAGLPVVALGGVTPARAAAARTAGASGIAALGGWLGASRPADAARALVVAWTAR